MYTIWRQHACIFAKTPKLHRFMYAHRVVCEKHPDTPPRYLCGMPDMRRRFSAARWGRGAIRGAIPARAPCGTRPPQCPTGRGSIAPRYRALRGCDVGHKTCTALPHRWLGASSPWPYAPWPLAPKARRICFSVSIRAKNTIPTPRITRPSVSGMAAVEKMRWSGGK
jgi:hypothetical protein